MQLGFKPEACIGCKLCELACSGTKEKEFNPKKARLTITSYYAGSDLKFNTQTCTFCLQCEEVCPADAISSEKGYLEYDPEACTDCGICVEECPEQVIVDLPEGVGICDFCQGEPECVNWCPHGALYKEVK